MSCGCNKTSKRDYTNSNYVEYEYATDPELNFTLDYTTNVVNLQIPISVSDLVTLNFISDPEGADVYLKGCGYTDFTYICTTNCSSEEVACTYEIKIIFPDTTEVTETIDVSKKGASYEITITKTGVTVKEITAEAPAGGCFIATAAYGTPLHKDLDILRDFRDSVLLKNGLGRIFVSLYYLISPPIASVVSRSKTLKKIVLKCVKTIIKHIDSKHSKY